SHVCVALTASGIARAEDLRDHELLVAGMGAGTVPSLVPQMLNALLGMHFKLVQGYASSADVVLALKRGEVSGLCHSWTFFRNLYADLIEQHVVQVLLHIEESPIPELPSVPSAFDFAGSDEARQMLRLLTSSAEFGRPFALPPGTPPERLTILRTSL